jgi:photosystem II stability/assembly factor-like uncharacterized protein
MADETLRRNLDMAFDPGPDFPHPLLLSRTMAILRAEAGTTVRTRWNGLHRLSWLRPAIRLAAILMVVIVAVAATAAILTMHRFFAPVPAHTPPFKVTAPGVGICSGACAVKGTLFVSTTIGWLMETTTWPCAATCPEQTSILFRTDDGGRHWKAQHAWNQAAGQIGQMLASPDARELLIVGSPFDPGSGLVLHSVDGGITWTSHGLPPGAGQAVETGCKGGHCSQSKLQPLMYFLNPREGWVLSQEQAYSLADLFHTTDSGAHWVLVARIDIKAQFNLDLATGLYLPNGLLDHSLPGPLVFQSSSTAWLNLGSPASDSSPHLFKSLDGGVTWRFQNILAPPAIDPSDTTSWTLKFFNDREAVLGFTATHLSPYTENHFVYTTSDGGDHWSSPIPVPNITQLEALFYVDVTHWVGLPIGGGWMRTADAGQHWDVMPATTQFGDAPAPGSGLPAQEPANWPPPWFAFLNPSQGWAYVLVQPNGGQSAGTTLYETNDGGVNWTPLSLPELK